MATLLYQGGTLGIFKNQISPSTLENQKIRESKKIFQKFSMKMVQTLPSNAICNLKIDDCLDATLNFLNKIYKPFSTSNNEINYIHKESNHPPSIIKQVPFTIESLLSSFSSSEKIFINKC